ncbi:hypothetical protein FACS1894105_12800 [Clostridia bacterium]|nr:hypothetical protein FACS1894105_12800 [Clostridia bacterium]
MNLPHLDLSEKWWNKTAVEELTVAGKLHLATGDANLTSISGASVIFVNQQVQYENAVPDLYQVVFDGGWTLDYMSELARSAYKDLNGNGKSDKEDQFGTAFNQWSAVAGFMQSSGIKFTSRDENGIPYLDAEQEKLATLADKVYNLLYSNEGVWFDSALLAEGMLKNNRLLFAPNFLSAAMFVFRDMEADYSILPYPKFDSEQEKYHTRIDGTNLLCVPINCNIPEAVGAFMEATASESYKSVSPVYFNTAMKSKYARDETSEKMLDIIRDGGYVNFASVYGNSFGGPWGVLTSLIERKNNNFASWYEKNEPIMKAGLEELVNKMKELD